MKLHSPAFERAINDGVRAELRADPALRREHHRVRKYNRRRIGTRWPFRLCITLVLAMVTGLLSARPGPHLDTGLLITSWAALMWALTLTQGWLTVPYRSQDAGALWLLPVSNATVFAWERQRIVRSSLFAFVDMLACIVAIGGMRHFSVAVWSTALPVVVLAWAFLMALSALLAAQLPTLPYGAMVQCLYMGGLGLYLLSGVMKYPVLPLLDSIAREALMLIPTGWAFGFLQLAGPAPDWSRALLAVPLFTVLATWPFSLGALARRCVYREPATPIVPDLVPGEVAPAAAGQPTRPLQLSTIEEGLESGMLLEQEPWDAGWMERLLWRWFTTREKTLAEFFFLRPLALTRSWYLIGRNFLITSLLGILAFHFAPDVAPFIFGIGLLIVCGHALMMVGNSGLTFQPVFNGGIGIPFYAPFPVTIDELSRLFLKCSVLQWPCIYILSLAIVVPATMMVGEPPELGVSVAFRTGTVLLAARICLLGVAFTSGLLDSRRFRPRIWFMLALSTMLGIPFLFFGGVAILSPEEFKGWACCMVALAFSFSFLGLCRWFYHSLRLDLMRTPR